MAKYAPQKKTFDLVKRLNKFNKINIWIVFVLSILPLVINEIKSCDPSMTLNIVTYIQVTNVLLLVGGFIISAIKDYYLFPKAEFERRKDLIDNSFDTKYTLKSSEEYFTNSEISAGVYKLGVNLFQNLLFTVTVSKKMRPKAILKSVLFIILFFLISFWGVKDVPIALPFLQLLFSAFVLGDLIKLLLYISKNEKTLDDVQNVFANNQVTDAAIYKCVLDYETNLAWGSLLLNDGIFNEINDETEEEWKVIKNKYQIKNA
jgi:hypothetical protein